MRTPARTIGLLGGMSWVSTAHYYRAINQQVTDQLGGDHCASLVLWQSDFARITDLQRRDNWEGAGEILAAGTEALVAAGAELIAICANPMHLVVDQVRAAAVGVEVVSIIDAVRDRCIADQVTTLGLLGTAYTMESAELYPQPLGRVGIEMLVPTAEERAEIQRHTFDELIRDVVTDEARTTFRRACEGLVERGADAIALACTEHGMVIRAGDLSVPVLDSTELHINELVRRSLA